MRLGKKLKRKMKGDPKLNLGCGTDYKEGYENIDISKECVTDMCYDITKGIKRDDNSVDEVFAGCVLEQIDDLVFVLNECYRVLKPDGKLIGYVPSTDPNCFYIDPMDKRFFTIETFDYFNRNSNRWEKFGKSYGYKPWEIVEVKKNDNGIIHFIMKK